MQMPELVGLENLSGMGVGKEGLLGLWRTELGLPADAPEDVVKVAYIERKAREKQARDEHARRQPAIAAALALKSGTTPTMLRRTDGAGLVYPGRTHSIAGESESGKTWIALYLAREYLEDTEDSFPQEVADILHINGPYVSYWDFDNDEESISERAAAIGLSEERFQYLDSPDTANLHDILWLWETVEGVRSIDGLVIIDNVTAAMESMGYRGISNEDVSRWFREVPQALSALGITVVLLDHLTKANDGTGRYALGGVQKLAALSGAQYIVEVIKPLRVGSTGQIELRVTKDRSGKVRAVSTDYRASDRSDRAALFTLDAEVPEELELSIEPPEPRKNVGEAARNFADEKLHEFIAQNPGANTRALREVNKDHTSLTKSLDRLKSEQKIYTQPGQRGSVLHYAVQ